MSIEECVDSVNKQKALIDQLKADKKWFDNSLLGRRNLMSYQDWINVLNREELTLTRLRAELSEARGE